ncbi:MAG: aldehyde ferredoxin oxidoreductase family protein [Candidatus Bathyarchaeia archaeon]
MSSLKNVLYIDLDEEKSQIVNREDIFEKYIGGAGVASRLLLEECEPKLDPFSPRSPIILAIGPLTTLLPGMAKAVSMFKSPLTGNLGESHASGHLGAAIRFAGYGAIVIKGASEKPVIIDIENDKVRIEVACSLWGLSPLDAEKYLRKIDAKGIQSILAIGIAGENLVYYSNVLVDRFHHFGRLGLGAIFGSKKIKAISIIGNKSIAIKDLIAFKELYEEIHYKFVETDIMAKYHDLGTPYNVLPLNELKALPTRNFKESSFEGAKAISGEYFAEKFLERKISCPACPIACIHLAALKTKFAPEHERGKFEFFKEVKLIPYNYEPIYALGSNLGISDPEKVLKLISKCEELGLDAMMSGTALAWATEAFERGKISLEDTLNVKLEWGNATSYLEMLNHMAEPKNAFYSKLAQGVISAAEAYGGKEYAIALGKNGLAGYITGYASILGTLVGARHSHLSNAGYSIDQKMLGNKIEFDKIVNELIKEEDWRYILTSLVICLFSRGIYNEELVVKALRLIGINKSLEELKSLGKEIFHNLYRFKLKEGFSLESEYIPERLFEVETPYGKLEKKILKAMLSKYIEKREKEGLVLRAKEERLKELLIPKSEF